MAYACYIEYSPTSFLFNGPYMIQCANKLCRAAFIGLKPKVSNIHQSISIHATPDHPHDAKKMIRRWML